MGCLKINKQTTESQLKIAHKASREDKCEQGWYSVDPLVLYDPVKEVEAYLDGQHNGGVFNSGNLASYSYTYGNPIKYVDPNGKQVEVTSGYSYQKIKSNYTRVSGGQKIINKPGSSLNWAKGRNSCAIRMSDALNKAGYNIPKAKETPRDVRIQNGNKNIDSGNYILDAVSMNNYLSDKETPTLSLKNLNNQEKIDNAMGQINALGDDAKSIIILTAGDRKEYGATGHVDLLENDWVGEKSLYGNGVMGFGNDLDDYLESNRKSNLSINIWVIKPEDEE